MGMAASQARLLTLTSRLHDVEFKAQSIQSQKIALATQKDELYQKYCDALDATKIQVAFNNGDGTKNFVDATFSTLCTYNEDRFMQYSLKDSKTGKVIVDAKTVETYENFNTDKYAFAYAMLGMEDNFGWAVNYDDGRYSMGMEVGIGVSNENYGDGMADNGLYNLFMTDVERMVFENHSDDDKLQKAYDNLEETCSSSSESIREQQNALEEFRDVLYNSYGTEIYQYMRLNKQDEYNTSIDNANAEYDDMYPEDYPKGEFEFYVHLFEEIQAVHGKCYPQTINELMKKIGIAPNDPSFSETTQTVRRIHYEDGDAILTGLESQPEKTLLNNHPLFRGNATNKNIQKPKHGPNSASKPL